MDNAPYYDQINAYLKGALSPEDRAAFEQALQTDPDLAAELDFQRSLKVAAERHAAQAEAKDIMAQLRRQGIFEDAAQQADRDRKLLESAQGDQAAIAKLLAEHPSLADWKALDPEGFEEVVKASTPTREKEPARVAPMWVWVRRVAAVAAVVVLGWVGYRIKYPLPFEVPKIGQTCETDSTKNQQSPKPEENATAGQNPAPKPGEDMASNSKLKQRVLRDDSLNIKVLIAQLDERIEAANKDLKLSSGFANANPQSCCIKNINKALYYLNDDWDKVLKLTASIARKGVNAAVFPYKDAEACDDNCDPKIVQFARIMFARAYVAVSPEKVKEIREMQKHLPKD